MVKQTLVFYTLDTLLLSLKRNSNSNSEKDNKMLSKGYKTVYNRGKHGSHVVLDNSDSSFKMAVIYLGVLQYFDFELF